MAVLFSILLALSSVFFTGPASAATYLDGNAHISNHILDYISGMCTVILF